MIYMYERFVVVDVKASGNQIDMEIICPNDCRHVANVYFHTYM